MTPRYRRPLRPKTSLPLPLMQATLNNAHTQYSRLLGRHRRVTTDFFSRKDNRQMQFFFGEGGSATLTNVLHHQLRMETT